METKIKLCIVLLLVLFLFQSFVAQTYRAEVLKLKQQLNLYKMKIDSIEDYPTWYKTAYEKCTCSNVPEVFQKECIAYEMRR